MLAWRRKWKLSLPPIAGVYAAGEPKFSGWGITGYCWIQWIAAFSSRSPIMSGGSASLDPLLNNTLGCSVQEREAFSVVAYLFYMFSDNNDLTTLHRILILCVSVWDNILTSVMEWLLSRFIGHDKVIEESFYYESRIVPLAPPSPPLLYWGCLYHYSICPHTPAEYVEI